MVKKMYVTMLLSMILVAPAVFSNPTYSRLSFEGPSAQALKNMGFGFCTEDSPITCTISSSSTNYEEAKKSPLLTISGKLATDINAALIEAQDPHIHCFKESDSKNPYHCVLQVKNLSITPCYPWSH